MPQLEPSRAGFSHEGWLSSSTGKVWVGVAEPRVPVKAEVVFSHGLGEHAGRYGHVAAAFSAWGIRFVAYDLPGHGRTEGVRGDVAHYGTFLETLRTVEEAQAATMVPRFLMGHSLGGQITLRYALEAGVQARFAGVVAGSPWLRLALVPPWWQVALARLAVKVVPGWRQRSPALRELLSADAAHWEGLPEAELLHSWVSARLYFGALRVGEGLLRRAGELHAPLLVFHGGADEVTCAQASDEFVKSAGGQAKEFTLYPGGRHETHNDVAREQVLQRVISWILARAGRSERRGCEPVSSTAAGNAQK